MGTRYPWWVCVWRIFVPMIGSEYEYESIFFLVGIGMTSCAHWIPYSLPSLVVSVVGGGGATTAIWRGRRGREHGAEVWY
jgi:hypothetical protein